MEISPDGTKLWIPNANPEETPYIGQKFQTVEEGVEFYKRRRVSKRVGCKARIVLTRNPKGEYKLHGVELRHTHCLCSTVARQFLKGKRKLDNAHKTFLANCAKANIGPTKGFRLYKEMVGSFSAIGATCIDFCNFRCNTPYFPNIIILS
nr:protein FAR1-RELATED SEQUENCE 5-like [Ipomoea batatas]